MEFRTQIEPVTGRKPIDHSSSIVMLGSCFTTEVGSRLERDGFDVTVNPMGALYNPATIASAIERALARLPYSPTDLTEYNGTYHCLDFPTQYQGTDAAELVDRLNNDITALAERLEKADTWIITFGTARVYEFEGRGIVGNCHKLPGYMFTRRLMTVNEIADRWQPLAKNRRVILTVSPIRHTADGMHGNQISKATLLLAAEQLDNIEYFPSYEIVIDDLRDYRFYAADMKHPSDVAVDYIYGKFAETYFTPSTLQAAKEARKASLRAAHRPILK